MVSAVRAKTFTAELERVQKTGTMFRVPFDLEEAFGRAFSSMSFTHRREYVEWVEEAKRADTRAGRIAATVERVRDGKPQR